MNLIMEGETRIEAATKGSAAWLGLWRGGLKIGLGTWIILKSSEWFVTVNGS